MRKIMKNYSNHVIEDIRKYVNLEEPSKVRIALRHQPDRHSFHRRISAFRCAEIADARRTSILSGLYGLGGTLQWDMGTGSRRRSAAEKCIMGNLNPVLTLQQGTVNDAERETARIVNVAKSGGSYIFCTGEGIPHNTPPENVKACVQTIRRVGGYAGNEPNINKI